MEDPKPEPTYYDLPAELIGKPPVRPKESIQLTRCEIAVYITPEIRDDEARTQELFDDVELALQTCQTIARNIREKYPFMRVEVRP